MRALSRKRGVEKGIRVPWVAPAERLPDAAGNAPCKGPLGRERGIVVAIRGNINGQMPSCPTPLPRALIDH